MIPEAPTLVTKTDEEPTSLTPVGISDDATLVYASMLEKSVVGAHL
jgi:hypothetical protein